MPFSELLTLLIARINETRLTRLAEVRYLTTFIQELETRLATENAEESRSTRYEPNNTAPANPDLEEAERLFIEERGYLNQPHRPTRARRPIRPATVRTDRPVRPIVASTHTRNHIIRRRRSVRQNTTQSRREANNRTYPIDSVLRRRPDASHVQQAGNRITQDIAEHLSEDIERQAVTHARANLRNHRTGNTSH